MAEILRKEGKIIDAVGFYLEVCYLDLNGPNNIGGYITDKDLLREFPPWDPKGAVAKLAPGIINQVSEIIQDVNWDKSRIEEIYTKRASLLHTSLRLPLSPSSAWKKLQKEFLK